MSKKKANKSGGRGYKDSKDISIKSQIALKSPKQKKPKKRCLTENEIREAKIAKIENDYDFWNDVDIGLLRSNIGYVAPIMKETDKETKKIKSKRRKKRCKKVRRIG